MSRRESPKIEKVPAIAKPEDATASLQFQSLDPDYKAEVTELRRQRMLCGWGLDAVEKWLNMIRMGDRLMYWIIDNSESPLLVEQEPPFLEHLDNASVARKAFPAGNPGFTPAGHFALDWKDYLGDETLTDRANGKIAFTSLYVLMSKKGRGYASLALKEAERIARDELHCTTITLTTLPAAYLGDVNWWASQGFKQPQDIPVYEEWYRRKGFTTYLHVPRHTYRTLDGEWHTIPCIVSEY